jgi:hypothetical protein
MGDIDVTKDDMKSLVARETVLVRARGHWNNINGLGRMMLDEVIAFGSDLDRLREMTPHGEWIDTLRNEFGLSQPQGFKYMAIARNPPALANHSSESDLGIDAVYALLAAPEADAVLAEMAEAGEEISRREVKAAVALEKAGENVTPDAIQKLAEKRKAEARKAKARAKEAAEAAKREEERANELAGLLEEAQARADAAEAKLAEVGAEIPKPPKTKYRIDPTKDREIESLREQVDELMERAKLAEHRAVLSEARSVGTTEELIDKTRRLAQLENAAEFIRLFISVDTTEYLRRLRPAARILADDPTLLTSELAVAMDEAGSLINSILELTQLRLRVIEGGAVRD